MFGEKIHRHLYIAFLSAIGFSLPTSVFLTSVFIIALAVNWFLDITTYRRFVKVFKNRSLLVFLIIYMLYAVYLFNTRNIAEGLIALRLKLPLLALPLIIGTSSSINSLEKRIILSSFIAGVLVASVTGTVNYFILSEEMADRREISLFISHIRLSLMVCMAFFITVYYTLIHDKMDFRFKYAYAVMAIWFGIFLMILLSFTGIIIFLVALFFTTSRLTRRGSMYEKYAGTSLIATSIIIVLILSYGGFMIKEYYTINEEKQPDYALRTFSGRKYSHFPERKYLENGYYVWRYICDEELRESWNRISTLDYDGKDLKGQELRYTLIRYMSSLGLKKDSVGISKLHDDDIDMIETGHANCRYKDGKSIGDRLYELIWQVDYYFKGGNPQGHSLTQRIEFARTGLNVFYRFPVFGTGTGDLNEEFQRQYEINKSPLDQKYRFITHNQYLTILITFGITGFLIFIYSLLYPVIKNKTFRDYLFTVFFIIALLSMLNEDTLETHTGVSFFALFYALFVFGTDRNEDINE